MSERPAIELFPGASKRAPIAPHMCPPCRREHKDPEPCYDIQVETMVDDPRRSMPRPSGKFETVHIPGCMGCSVYGHDRCTCGPMLGQPDSDERAVLLGNMSDTLREARETINRYEQALERIADRERYKVTGAEGRYLARIARRALDGGAHERD